MPWLEENVLPRVYAELQRFKTADMALIADIETALNVPERDRLGYVSPEDTAAATQAEAEQAAQVAVQTEQAAATAPPATL